MPQPLHPFKDSGEVADSLDRHPHCNGEVPQQELLMLVALSVPTGENAEDSYLASTEPCIVSPSIGHRTVGLNVPVRHPCSDCQRDMSSSLGRS